MQKERDNMELSTKEKLSEALAVALCFLMLLGFFLKVVFF